MYRVVFFHPCCSARIYIYINWSQPSTYEITTSSRERLSPTASPSSRDFHRVVSCLICRTPQSSGSSKASFVNVPVLSPYLVSPYVLANILQNRSASIHSEIISFPTDSLMLFDLIPWERNQITATTYRNDDVLGFQRLAAATISELSLDL